MKKKKRIKYLIKVQEMIIPYGLIQFQKKKLEKTIVLKSDLNLPTSVIKVHPIIITPIIGLFELEYTYIYLNNY